MMLSVPMFCPWRPVWDDALGPATNRLDELVRERQLGRSRPPTVTREIIRIVLSERVQSVLDGKSVSSPDETLEVIRQLRPLIEAAVWPRWLLLEEALEVAADEGTLHLSAMVLRTQIEELDALKDVAGLLAIKPEEVRDAASLASAIEVLVKRVLPRVRLKSADDLLAAAGEAPGAGRRSRRMQSAFDALGDYVHPNYGSHVLTIRPHSVEAAKIIVDAFVAVYEEFLALPWARDVEDRSSRSHVAAVRDEVSPFLVLADKTVPLLSRAFDTGLEVAPWPAAIDSFRLQATLEEQQSGDAEAVEDGRGPAQKLRLDVGAVQTLRERGASQDSWPVPVSTPAERLRYAFLVEVERQLVAEAERIGSDAGERGGGAWLSLLCSALSFSINLTELKLGTLARQAARLLNAENVLGATLAVRSMLEHHAVAVELGKKLRDLWDRVEGVAPHDERISALLREAERQIARVLATSPVSRERATTWRGLWEGSVRRYHVLDPIKALDAEEPGFLRTYGLLSHIVHGTICTGGDLLGEGGTEPAHRTLAQLALFLAELCASTSMLKRQARSIDIAHRIDILGAAATPSLGAQIVRMRLRKGQKLKGGRDVLGSGTREDPFRFRQGLLYHDAYRHWLKQEDVRVRRRTMDIVAGGVCDRVETEDDRTLYFLNKE